MPTPRKPLAELIESGTYGKNVGRYKNRLAATTVAPSLIGRPPRYLKQELRDIWCEIVNDSNTGLLGRGDRVSLEVLVHLVAKMRTSTDLKPSETKLIMDTLAKLRMTPTDRARADLPVTEPPPSGADADKWAALDELDD